MLTTEEILKKVRALEIKSKRLTNHMFTGEYHSAFKGQGMSYKEVREYQPGDDIRFIDWNVSARYAHPYSKVFEEEREQSVFLLIDNSASISFGTHLQRKKDLVTELAAVLAFSAVNNNDKVGAILFGDKVQRFIAPKKARQHTLYIVREMLGNDAASKQTNYTDAFRMFNNVCRRKSICFLISDFLGKGYEEALRVACKKHDVIGIKIYDQLDMRLPEAGLLQVADAETGEQRWIDSSNASVRFEYEKDFHKHNDHVKDVFRRAGADLLHMRAGDDYVKVLQKFFINRIR
ncbi:MAG: DUF58 domain-containing protein [Chitinophagaceae bacterium]|nr:DUF58 domain-containing protein [Chitinophagaceae bacterium]